MSLKKWDSLSVDQRAEVSFLVDLQAQLEKATQQLLYWLDKNRNWQLYLDDTAGLLRDCELRLHRRVQELTGLSPGSLRKQLADRHRHESRPKT